MNNEFHQHLKTAQRLHVQQVYEGFEIVLGWETRNKYRILDEAMRPIAFAAEEKTGMGGALMRQFFGHWRSFKMQIFDEKHQQTFEVDFPFRWFFKTLILRDMNGKELGYLQQRWALFRKKFDIHDDSDRVIARINSPFFKIWTFDVRFGSRKLGTIQKKWGGVLGEFFTDKDNYVVSYADPNLTFEVKSLMLAMTLMVDIVYFENNQGKKSIVQLFD